MALDPRHEEVVRIALALPEGQTFALAGGGAMLAHNLVNRLTHDVDLFSATPDVPAMASALGSALVDRSYTATLTRSAGVDS